MSGCMPAAGNCSMESQRECDLNTRKSCDEEEEDRYFQVALSLVKHAGNIVREAYNHPREMAVTTKASDVDLVTETDRKVEDMLFENLAKEFPDHKFIGEESAHDGAKIEFTEQPTWIIDPIDGTTNFVHRMPFLCISVGLTVKKKPRIGIIYNPISDELYTARAGRGAYKNGFRIYASGAKELNKALIMGSFGIHNIAHLGPSVTGVYMRNWEAVIASGTRGHRSLGSAALNMCYVAQGSADCYLEYGIHCWDVAAGALIVEEAGGACIDPAGGPFDMMRRRVLCASSAELAKTLSSNLTHVDYPPEFE